MVYDIFKGKPQKTESDISTANLDERVVTDNIADPFIIEKAGTNPSESLSNDLYSVQKEVHPIAAVTKDIRTPSPNSIWGAQGSPQDTLEN